MPDMIRVVKGIPPPVSVSDELRAMARGDCLDLSSSAKSVRSIVSRIKGEFEGARDYKTQVVGKRVRVWRTH